MIQLSNISKSFKKQEVLSKLELNIEQGEHVMLTGVSGCGKSTLLRLIAGLDTPDQGEIVLGTTVVTKDGSLLSNPEERSIGFMPQDLGLWSNLNVKQNIQLGRKLDPDFYAELLKRAELSQFEKESVSLLSAGEKQRVALVRALVSRPKILLLDEPFASLDLIKRSSFYKSLKELTSENSTIATVSHDPTDWHGLNPDRLVVIEDKKNKEEFRKDLFNTSPKSRLLQAWYRYNKYSSS